MKTKKCRVCNTEYDTNYLKCPNCGTSNTLHFIKSLIVSIIVVVAISMSTYTLLKVNKLSNEIEYINEKLGINQSLKLEDQPYYNNYVATSDNFDAMINGVDSYILYFYKDKCIDCEKTNAYIDAYISMGFSNLAPFIFVSPDAKDIYNRYKVENTPTAILVNNETTQEARGLNEIYQLLNGIIETSFSE